MFKAFYRERPYRYLVIVVLYYVRVVLQLFFYLITLYTKVPLKALRLDVYSSA